MDSNVSFSSRQTSKLRNRRGHPNSRHPPKGLGPKDRELAAVKATLEHLQNENRHLTELARSESERAELQTLQHANVEMRKTLRVQEMIHAAQIAQQREEYGDVRKQLLDEHDAKLREVNAELGDIKSRLEVSEHAAVRLMDQVLEQRTVMKAKDMEASHTLQLTKDNFQAVIGKYEKMVQCLNKTAKKAEEALGYQLADYEGRLAESQRQIWELVEMIRRMFHNCQDLTKSWSDRMHSSTLSGERMKS
ncbi:hypothetical protein V5O48_018466 [Marasmius crinis-equi]|uniref:Coiled-coil domain-containing protein 153 n=1 Tax=Marasmius crinis-equi TaxID=585013 RepID=A0ABR3EL43_9AGAR